MGAGSARDALIDAAERLIGELGHGVSLRDVAQAAGQRNNSAVHYHFGDRDGLVQAVLRARLGPQEVRRTQMLAELDAAGRGDDVPSLVSVLVVPMLEVPRDQGTTHYARFLEQVRTHPDVDALGTEAGPHNAALREVLTRLGRLLPLRTPVRAWRLRAATQALFAWLADLERTGRQAQGVPTMHGEVVRMIVGMLTAPTAT